MEQQTVHLFVPDTMSDWEPGYAVAGINQPAYQQNPGRYTLRTVGTTRDPVRTMGGITLVPDMALAELRPEDSAMLILPGSAAWDAGADAEAVEAARAFLDISAMDSHGFFGALAAASSFARLARNSSPCSLQQYCLLGAFFQNFLPQYGQRAAPKRRASPAVMFTPVPPGRLPRRRS